MITERRFYCLLVGYSVSILGFSGSVTHGRIDATPEEKRETYKRFGCDTNPTNVKLFQNSNGDSVHVCYFNYDQGRIVVESGSREDAYRLAALIRGYYTLFIGWPSYNGYEEPFIRELTSIPEPEWSVLDLIRSHDFSVHPEKQFEDDFDPSLLSGVQIMQDSIEGLVEFLSAVEKDDSILGAITNLTYSRFLFNGFMVPSYWSSHYCRDVDRLTDDQREKAYLEGQVQYESAFLAAFKAIEHLLHSNNFNKRQVKDLVKQCGYPYISENPEYRRKFETFINKQEVIRTSNIISEYLDMRNAAAAHGNSCPPKNLRISFDSVYEIQELVVTLIDHAAAGLIEKNDDEKTTDGVV